MRNRSFIIVWLLLIAAVMTGATAAQGDTISVTITSPTEGQTLTDLDNIVISGTATNVFEGNVVVQARDFADNVLVEEPTTAEGAMGGTGNWQVTLAVDVAPGLTGNIRAFSTSPQDGSVVAEAIVNVQYGETLPTDVTITRPVADEILPNAGSFLVEGTATNVFEGNVVVQARNEAGTVLVEQPTTAEGAMGGTGNWSISLNVNVPSGTRGSIRAFSTSPQDGSVVAEAVVNVQYGPVGIPNIELNITSPADGAIVATGGNGVLVTGTTRDLSTGDVLVQLRDAANNVIAERAVKSAPTTGVGNWQATIPARFPVDTIGSILAQAPGIGDGGFTLSDIVFVTFQANCSIRTDWPVYTVVRGDYLNSIARRTGSTVDELAQANCLNNPSIISVGQPLRVPRLPQPGTPIPSEATLNIAEPLQNGVVAIGTPVTIRGTASGLPQDRVTVQAVDANSVVLAGQTTSVNNGQWQVPLLVNTIPGTSGRIVVFATSPTDGSVVATTSINVTYGQGEVSEVMIEITSPQANTEVNFDGSISISGTSSGLFEGNLIVRALDNEGNVLAEEPTTANTDGDWSLDLDVEVEESTRGTLYAYAQSAQDGSLVAVDAVNVIYGIGGAGPVVTITDPIPYSSIVAEDSFKVSGLGESLFENTLVVQVLDASGEIVFEEPTLLNTDDFEGAGQWEIEIPALEGVTRGKIVAYATTPEDGSIITSFSVDVVFGDPAEAEGEFVLINNVLPGTQITADRGIGVSGFANGIPSGQVTVQVINAEGDVLASQSAQIDPDSRRWDTSLTLVAVEPDSEGRIVAFGSGEGGSVIAREAVGIRFGA